jgi:hypothetical protein
VCRLCEMQGRFLESCRGARTKEVRVKRCLYQLGSITHFWNVGMSASVP